MGDRRRRRRQYRHDRTTRGSVRGRPCAGPGAPAPRELPPGAGAPAPAERRARAAALAPHLRAIASQDHRMVGHFTDGDAVLDFLAQREAVRASPSSARPAPTTSCAPRSSRSCSTCPAHAPVEECVARLAELHEQYRADYTAYYERHATPDSPPMRGADPAIILVPGVGMFSYGKDKQTARVAGEFYVNAINVMRGAEALSTYAPIPEAEKFRIEYWALEEAKLAAPARSRSATPGASPSSPAPRAASAGPSPTRLAAEGACVVIADLDVDSADAAAAELGGPTSPWASTSTSPTAAPVRGRRRATRCSPSVASTSSSTTPGCRSPSRCSRRPRRTGTSSTTSWPRAASSSRRPRRGR